MAFQQTIEEMLESAQRDLKQFYRQKEEHPADLNSVGWVTLAIQMATKYEGIIATLISERDRPEILDFMKGIPLEASHQRERWGAEHDQNKTDADWFWLVGYLVGKALHQPDKRRHHLITAAAALANWHLYTMRKSK